MNTLLGLVVGDSEEHGINDFCALMPVKLKGALFKRELSSIYGDVKKQ